MVAHRWQIITMTSKTPQNSKILFRPILKEVNRKAKFEVDQIWSSRFRGRVENVLFLEIYRFLATFDADYENYGSRTFLTKNLSKSDNRINFPSCYPILTNPRSEWETGMRSVFADILRKFRPIFVIFSVSIMVWKAVISCGVGSSALTKWSPATILDFSKNAINRGI